MARLAGFIGNRPDLGPRAFASERLVARLPGPDSGGTSWGLGFYQGGEILLKAETWPTVERVLQHIDVIEALGINPADVDPAHWRHVHHRIRAGETPSAYTPPRHEAWLEASGCADRQPEAEGAVPAPHCPAGHLSPAGREGAGRDGFADRHRCRLAKPAATAFFSPPCGEKVPAGG